MPERARSGGARVRNMRARRRSCSRGHMKRSRRCAQALRPPRPRAETSLDILLRPVADKHAKTSKYTADRNMPGAVEGETITRRRFMTGTAHTAGAIAAGAFTLPALAFAIGPIFKSTPNSWVTVGKVGSFPNNNYVPVIATLTPGLGDAGKTTVHMRG